jgi:exonuclease SbcC
MLPLKLSFQGLYSYKNQVEIDFSQLTQAGLFGIFGAVGSGKSAILDAISLALYGQIERLNKQETKHLINLRSNELNISFEFLAGKESNRYLFNYKKKLNKKREVQETKQEQYIWDKEKENWLPIEQTGVDILKISYENFKRTIILPQGKFQEFLLLGGKEKTQMLSEIFSLEQYDNLEKKLKGNISKKNQEELNKTKTELELIQYANQEKIDELNVLLVDNQQHKQTTNKELKELNELNNQYETNKKIFFQIKEQEKIIEQLNKKQDYYQEKEKEITLFEEAKNNFQQIFEYQKQAEIKLISLQNNEKKEAKETFPEEKQIFFFQPNTKKCIHREFYKKKTQNVKMETIKLFVC